MQVYALYAVQFLCGDIARDINQKLCFKTWFGCVLFLHRKKRGKTHFISEIEKDVLPTQ